MAYASFELCHALYPSISEVEFDTYSWESGREIDRFTTGVDGVIKLKIAFPTDEDDAQAVKRAFCEILYTLVMIGKQKAYIAESSGTTVINGHIVSNRVASMSSGSENISFDNNVERGQYYTAATNTEERNKLIYSIVKSYLGGIKDANGVNLLYGGKYPCGRTQ